MFSKSHFTMPIQDWKKKKKPTLYKNHIYLYSKENFGVCVLGMPASSYKDCLPVHDQVPRVICSMVLLLGVD